MRQNLEGYDLPEDDLGSRMQIESLGNRPQLLCPHQCGDLFLPEEQMNLLGTTCCLRNHALLKKTRVFYDFRATLLQTLRSEYLRTVEHGPSGRQVEDIYPEFDSCIDVIKHILQSAGNNPS